MVIYHHSDMDGRAAAWICKEYLPETGLVPKDKSLTADDFYECDYDSPMNHHTPNDIVVIVDISFGGSEESIEKLCKICDTARGVIWIDHHQTSVDFIEDYKSMLHGRLAKLHGRLANLFCFVSNEACGAVLAYSLFKGLAQQDHDLFEECMQTRNDNSAIIRIWDSDYMYGEDGVERFRFVLEGCVPFWDKYIGGYNYRQKFTTMCFMQTIPMPLALINDYDLWRKEHEVTDAFILGVTRQNFQLIIKDHSNGQKSFNYYWADIMNPIKMKSFIDIGDHIISYLDTRYQSEMRDCFEWEYDGNLFLCKNAFGNSWNFGSKINEHQYKAVILFHFDGSLWHYSVYAGPQSDFNCQKFAERFGGGGHYHAAGFTSNIFLFNFYTEEIGSITIKCCKKSSEEVQQ